MPDDEDDTSTPDGYTRYTPDPSHRGEAMRQKLRSHWLATEDLEMSGLIKHKVWERVLRSTFLPSDTIFQTRFHYKIKSKGGVLLALKHLVSLQGRTRPSFQAELELHTASDKLTEIKRKEKEMLYCSLKRPP